MLKKIFNLLVIIVVGGISGVLACQLLLPWLAGFKFFEKFDWIRASREGTTVINKTEEIIITENEAFEQAVEKSGRLVVGIVAQQTERTVNRKKIALSKPEILAQGTGFLVSSDGLVATAADIVPEIAQRFIVILDGRQKEAQVQKRDKERGLALLKISESNLSVAPFAEGQLKLGQQVFLVGAKNSEQLSKFAEFAIVGEVGEEVIVNFLRPDSNGAPIFNVRSEIVGVNLVNASGESSVVLSDNIRDLVK